MLLVRMMLAARLSAFSPRRCAVLAAAMSLALASHVASARTGAALPAILPAQGTVQVAFTPGDDIEGIIVARLGAARRQILMQAYLLTNRNIVDALVDAHARGVDVRVMVDGGQLDKNSREHLQQLRTAGIAVWLETRYRNAHNKVIVIDAGLPAATVITGSFNFTWSAQHKNAENILVLANNAPLAARYASNWQRHREEADPAP